MTGFSCRRGLFAGIVGLALMAPATVPGPAAAGGVYFVKEGDTLYRISRTFNVDVERLRRLNGLTSSDLKPGDRVRIPDQPAAPRPDAAVAPEPVVETAAEPDPVGPTAAPAATDSVAEPVVALGAPRAIPEPSASGHPLEAAATSLSGVDRLLCREERVYHRIVKGETLSALSRRYGVPLEDLFSLNKLTRRSRLSIGQRILVRRSGPRTHIVRRGETLTRIAARTGVRVDDLRRFNPGVDRLAVGDRLLLESCDRFALAGSSAPEFPGSRRSADGSASRVDRLVDFAKDLLDIPYRFGGNSLRGIDCSAYVQRVYGLLDLPLPRTAREQFAVGERVGREELAVGDLVFFRTYASYASHVGIYLGGDRFIHASSVSRRVTIDSIDRPYYRKRFLGARRLLPEAADQVASVPR